MASAQQENGVASTPSPNENGSAYGSQREYFQSSDVEEMGKSQDPQPDPALASVDPAGYTEERPQVPRHIQNAAAHPAWLRYGLPLYLIGTFVLLLCSDLGSGVSADLQLTVDGEVKEYVTILTVSVFSSIGELWKAGSYPLAILIIVTSICWPYVKLFMSFMAWVVRMPGGGRKLGRWECVLKWVDVFGMRKWGLGRWECILEWVDALGKWSFVDIFVLIFMMVAFRSTIPLGYNNKIDVVIVPKWGFYGFVAASMLSLIGTHVILYHHRRVVYDESDEATNSPPPNADDAVAPADFVEEQGEPSTTEQKTSLGRDNNTSSLLVLSVLLITFVLQIVGATLDTFTFTYERGKFYDEEDFSLIKIGQKIPDSSLEPNSFGIRWIQAVYFLLTLGTPSLNLLSFAWLYFRPMTARRKKTVFFMTEVLFAWGAIEVYIISAIFSVAQIPDFGTGIVDSGCDTCYVVGAKLLPSFAVIAVGAVMNAGMSFWLFVRAHHALYGLRGNCCCSCK